MARYQPLTASAQVAYSDLLASLIAAPIPGKGISYFTRPVKGRDYWYMQYMVGETKKSHYIGPDNEATRALVNQARELLEKDAPNQDDRKRLVATGIAAGLNAPNIAEARVLETLVQAGLFEAGAVLIGSHAFLVIGNMLSVRWESSAARTEDIDIAKDTSIEVAAPNREIDLVETLRTADKGFFPVPALNPKHPATKFKVRNRSLTVSLLTPEKGKPATKPVVLPGLNVAAEPVRYLGYLIEESQVAAVPVGAGLLVRVPDPARFALHKLVVSQRRPAAMASKGRKDIEQAASILDVLKELRPGDIDRAVNAANEIGGKFMVYLNKGIKLLEDFTSEIVIEIIKECKNKKQEK